MSIIADMYAQVPEVPCKGLCQQACGPIGCSGIEAAALQDNGIDLPRVVRHPTQGSLTCSHLDDAGRCGIYAQRPLICRLYGATPPMICPHGCRPRGGYISDERARALINALTAASGSLPPHVAIL